MIGGNLVAYNDVTKKITTKIDLRHAKTVIDEDDTSRRRRDSADALFQIDRAFRIVFDRTTQGSRRPDEICFYADTDEEKTQWLDVLGALVGNVPPNPLWAELVWQRQQESERDRGKRAKVAARAGPIGILVCRFRQTRPSTSLNMVCVFGLCIERLICLPARVCSLYHYSRNRFVKCFCFPSTPSHSFILHLPSLDDHER